MVSDGWRGVRLEAGYRKVRLRRRVEIEDTLQAEEAIRSYWIDLLILALALGTDAFSLGAGIGLQGVIWPEIYRISSVIGLFHILMSLAGLLPGSFFGQAVRMIGTAIGVVLLTGMGIEIAWNVWRQSFAAVALFGAAGGMITATGLVSGKKAGSYLAGCAEAIGGLVLFTPRIKFRLG